MVRTAGGAALCPNCLARGLWDNPTDTEIVPDPSSTLPRQFGEYELLEEMGRGGMGVVYRARQTSLDRQVAVKLLLGGAYSSEDMLRRFQREAAAAAGLQHPGIVPIFDYGEWEGQPYYAMELIKGRDLAALTAGRPLQARRSVEILRDLARAVTYAHERGIIHRDLKPSNVLIADDGHVCITDFGIAKRLGDNSDATLSSQILGSPSYASPEQAAGRSSLVGPASDVYALGALGYHLLTGRAPFSAEAATDTLRLVLGSEPVSPRLLNPALPRDLETICLKCLAKDPARRYRTASALAEDLQRYLENRPIHARPPSLIYRMRQFVRRHRFGVTATAGSMAALIVGLAVALAGLQRAIEAQSATDLARMQAEGLLTRFWEDLRPDLADRGGLRLLRSSTESAIRYFESLPSELRDVKTEQRHAAALESLISIRKAAGDREGLEQLWREAVTLRRGIAGEIPNDAEAAAELLKDEYSARSSLIAVLGDIQALTDERVRREILNEWRQLSEKFPESPRVKLGLADELLQYAFLAMGPWFGMYRPQEGRMAAEEAGPLVDELSAENPDLPGVRTLRWFAGGVKASIHLNANEPEMAVATYEQLVTEIEAFLQDDPGSLSTRRALAANISGQSFAMTTISLQRAAEISRRAREQYRMLMRLDPTNRSYALEYSHTYINECYYLAWGDCTIEPARKLFQEWDAICEPFRETDPKVRSERWWRSIYMANLAARAGDNIDAQALIVEAQRRFEFCRDRLPDFVSVRRRTRIEFLSQMSWPLLYLRDWEGLERTSRESLELVDTALGEQTGDSDLPAYLPVAHAFLGRAMLESGHCQEAEAVLELALDEFRSTTIPPTFKSASGVWQDAIESLAEAVRQRGDVTRARELLESALRSREAGVVGESGSWLQREAIAVTLIKLGSTYSADDSAEKVRRAELFDRAWAILDSPEADGRITMDGKTEKADVEIQRTATSPRSARNL